MQIKHEIFAHLHEALISTWKCILDEMGIPHPLDPPHIYGFGTGVGDKYSLSAIVEKRLEEQGYDLSAFPETKSGNRRLQGQTLNRARLAYETDREIDQLSEKFWRAYLAFLQVQNEEELLSVYALKSIPEKLLQLNDNRGRRANMVAKSQPKHFRSLSSNPSVPIEVREVLKDSSWYLYSWNDKDKNIVRAVIKIGDLNKDGLASLHLTNPSGKGYNNYEGFLSTHHIKNDVLQFDLHSTPISTKFMTITSQYDFERVDPIELSLGIMIKKDEFKQLVSADVILEIINPAQKNPKPQIIEHRKSDSEVFYDFFHSTDYCLSQVPRFVFTKEELAKYIKSDKHGDS